MRETQQSISDWANATFGPGGSNARIAARVNEEVAELLRAITAGKPTDKIIDECADVAIIMERLAGRHGHDLFAMIDGVSPDSAPPLASAVELNTCMAALMWGEALGFGADKPGWSEDRYAGVLIQAIAYALVSTANAFGGDLRAAIDAKMVINRAREWKLDGTGHGYHVRAGGAAEARA